MKMAAKIVSVSIRGPDERMRNPSPALAVMNSATTMPVTASVAATLVALRKYGNENGIRTLTNVCQSDAVNERQSRTAVGSAFCKPVSVEIRTGKKLRKVANVMRDADSVPSQTMNKGASATFGMS